MVSPESPYVPGPSPFGDASLFKKHKVLPHPKNDRVPRSYNGFTSRLPPNSSVPTSDRSASMPTQRRQSLRHHSQRIGSGHDLPPTPPTHSRSSSSSQSVLPSSPTCVATPEDSVESIARDPPDNPSTPPAQGSPPTPDVTPPGPAITKTRQARPNIVPRINGDASRSDSYVTALEYPMSDEEFRRGKSTATVRPKQPPSNQTSQSTVRRLNQDTQQKSPEPIGLGLDMGIESSPAVDKEESDATPKGKGDRIISAECKSSGSIPPITKRRGLPAAPTTPNDVTGGKTEVLEDDVMSPTNATKALRSMQLNEGLFTQPSPIMVKDSADDSHFWTLLLTSQSSTTNGDDNRRMSTLSTRSTVSTVVEAILVDAPPQRQKTLRHMRKAATLRDSASDLATTSPRSTQMSQFSDDRASPRRPNRLSRERRHNSIASNATMSSIASSKAKNVRKSGGIPVVIIPERRSSIKGNNRPPSLRSTSSRRSKRTNSVGSIPLDSLSASKDLSPYFERPSRRRRATLSETTNSLEGTRTIDYPPVVPVRSSSLSAPTSRTASQRTSRAGSLTAESLKAHEALQKDLKKEKSGTSDAAPDVKLERAATTVQDDGEGESGHHQHHSHSHHLNVDSNGDPFFGRRHSLHKTPISQASVETNGTSAAEVAEAQAVNLYSHQNSSVLMVDHSNRPSDSSEDSLGGKKQRAARNSPKKQDGAPMTPPQPQFSLQDVDSPLRNPRAPPEPPVHLGLPMLEFIPATPSGVTPAPEKERTLGNFFEELHPKPERRESLVRRAFSRHRHTEDRAVPVPSLTRRCSEDQGVRPTGFLGRTLSLSRNLKRSATDRIPGTTGSSKRKGKEAMDPDDDEEVVDESKLHPWWRPHYSDSDEEWDPDTDDHLGDDDNEKHYRYPAIDNRPSLHRRDSLSAKLKRTFAILPIEKAYEYHEYRAGDLGGTDKRTIRRTGSGNLRVIRQRMSFDSATGRRRGHEEPLPHGRGHSSSSSDDEKIERRPQTAPQRSATVSGASGSGRSRAHSLRHKERFLGLRSGNFRGNGVVKPIRSPSPRVQVRGKGKGKLRGWVEEYGIHTLPRRLSERRREKRSRVLRGKISGPREVRDGVGEVVRR